MGNKPIINSYCAADRLYAGEYPGDKSADKAKEKLAAFCSFGITHFIDLTEEGELEPYAHLLPEGVVHRRFPIADVSVPESHDDVTDLLVYIDQVLSSSEASKVYVHCWGGVGRTGTIIGCYYVHKGYGFVSALGRLRESFKQCPKSERSNSPETLEQEKFLADYAMIRGSRIGSGWVGEEALPEFYKKDLELHEVIIHVADDLYEGKVSKYH
ncbi:MAG: dual specificity protein phosphatase family protein [Bacteroidales bacterium]|nr:dual specificity protein phosphatase family protein [Bacteroidales bacterium]